MASAETVKIKLEVDGKDGKKQLKEFEFSLESLEDAYKQAKNETLEFVEVMQKLDGGFVRVKLSAKEVAEAINKIKAERLEAFKKSAQNLQDLGDKISGVGQRITAAFTIPVVGALAAAVSQSKELQAALLPIQQAFQGVAAELGNALVPIVREFTPLLLDMARALTDIIRQFNTLPTGSKNAIVAIVGVAAAIGPMVAAIGEGIKTIAMFKLAMAGLGIGGAKGAVGAAVGAGVKGVGGAAAAGGAGAGVIGGAIAGGALLQALPGAIAMKVAEALGVPSLDKQWTVASYGVGRLFGGEQGGLAAAGAVGRATGAVPPVVVNYTNNGVDANGRNWLQTILAPFINSQLRTNGQR